MRERIGLPLVFLFLVAVVVFGVDMIAHPQRHLRGYVGGEMHRELKKTEIQVLGVLVIGGACWGIYAFASEFGVSCFG